MDMFRGISMKHASRAIHMKSGNLSDESAFSIIELVVTVALSATLLGASVIQFQDMLNPALSGAAEVGAFFKEARARAVSTTSAYLVRPDSATRLVAFYGSSCSSTPTQDNRLILDLPDQVTLTNLTWDTCFTSRGLADSNVTVYVQDGAGQTNSAEVFLGGAVKIQ